jgi:hypothetical protein
MGAADAFFAREFAWLGERQAAAAAGDPGPLDPLGDWTQGWAIWELSPERRRLVVERAGGVVLRRSRLAEGRFRLGVRLWLEMLFGVAHGLEAAMRCRLDATASPAEWWARGTVRRLDQYRSADPLFGLERAGRVTDGELTLTVGGRERRVGRTGRLACDWGLFEAVPRLAGPVRPFTLLCDFASLRPEHELFLLGSASTPAGELEGFLRVGSGGLPTSYWRGPDGRLRYVRQGYRAFTWEPAVWERGQA